MSCGGIDAAHLLMADNIPFTNVIVAGAGYVGKRIAQAYREKGKSVLTLTRNSSQGAKEIPEVNIDLDKPVVDSIRVDRQSLVYYLVPPNPQASEDRRIRHFVGSALNAKPGKFVLISTTGVYGNCNGRWVNEQFPINPQTNRAKRRAYVEGFTQQWAKQNALELVVLRVAGIYGPDRVPVERIAKGLTLPPRSDIGFSNRIHVDDLVEICMAASKPAVSGIYNAADGIPLRMIDYMNLVAEIWGLPRVKETSDSDRLNALSESMKQYLRESRKIDNSKILQHADMHLRYRDLRVGLAACLSATERT